MKINEDTIVEQPVLDWFKELKYDYAKGPDISPGMALSERDDPREVVLKKRLNRALRRLNPQLPETAIQDAIDQLVSYEHPSLIFANKDIHKMLTEGIGVDVKNDDGEVKGEIAKVIDFENPDNNEFMAVNQFAVQGPEVIRRPDIVIFVNGIPLAMFEAKSPTSQRGTTAEAFKQIQDYKKDIPDIFKYNQIIVIGDLDDVKHGTISSTWEWFGVWKGIESEDEKNDDKPKLEVLVKGIFQKQHLLDIIENFTVFEADSDKDATTFTKKMCMYHQYYGVNKAVVQTIRATKPRGNKKIGVFWHTQGSGKSLSMVFYINKIKNLSTLKSPTIVFLTDRNDLDDQLFKVFKRTGYTQFAKKAESISDLKEKLKAAGAEIIFTTIQKFETESELLSERENIIVVSDEAHRSQYAKLAGNVRQAIPNASFMGITGTPISLHNRDTRIVFGDYISTYQIQQAVQDEATVPIYYEGRLVPLHITNEFIDEELNDVLGEKYEMDKQLRVRLEQAIGAKDRLEQIAKDILEHFNNRGLEGKGMIVTMSRRIAVQMYEILSKMKNAPEMAVVISKLEEFKGKIQKEMDNKEIEKRFKNFDDSLKLVIVCDMWLTGFDVPSLHTMYIDKPLKNHTLMQAIARVNRIFRDKPGGLIVDYIGIADNLKKALSIYSADIRKEALIPLKEVIDKMMEKYDIVYSMFNGIDLSNWKKLEKGNLARLFHQAVNTVITDKHSGVIDEDKKRRFIEESAALYKLFALVMPHSEAHHIRDEVEFFQAVKLQIRKMMAGPSKPGPDIDIESALRELISKSIAAEGVIDIFKMKEKGKPDISIFDEKFLEEVKKVKFKNVAIEVLRKLLNDEIRVRLRKNVIRYKSLMEILEQIIEQYENKIINSAQVIENLIALAKEIRSADKSTEILGLTEEEAAFYDAIKEGKGIIMKDKELKELVQTIVVTIRRDLAVDWTNSEIIKSRIRANVTRLLMQKQFPVEKRETVIHMIFEQAKALYCEFNPAIIQ
ncbi:MAG: DEAD/DEAH box helicase [Candidatus Kerfeldbacteria bacterium CG08_land_8_20_14_0_20_40_16]|uniref:Type I restriction enzyme endonuclease subunit n=1 Tax=Candidatus Kerfeldbacteria bacterium CG08_land_8_20_14_0_20_40_16 TaxID=2014244 RepID=A0A2H0YX47_9BACT|nr:MAG: DEAD/DEAH box helicase [Candidatus Kerfeldbacteria bacterium CG08_land_8_20_14_0_20_40_16]